MQTGSFTDYYDVLQVSPTADPETIHRVYRFLAQRVHPDNRESGNPEAFKRILEAYRVLGDPEKRAAYDVEHSNARRVWWKIFGKKSSVEGTQAEREKRQGILSILYRKRMVDPERPALPVREMEELLACPREHLQFSLWYLKETRQIHRTDQGKYTITVDGVEAAESGAGMPPESIRLLPSGETQTAVAS